MLRLLRRSWRGSSTRGYCKGGGEEEKEGGALTYPKGTEGTLGLDDCRGQKNAAQVGLGPIKATRYTYIHNHPDLYNVSMPVALGSEEGACKYCWRCDNACIWPSLGKGISCTKCQNHKVKCVPRKTQDGDHEPLETLKDDNDEERMPRKGHLRLLR